MRRANPWALHRVIEVLYEALGGDIGDQVRSF
jgi:hypothetical protein